LYDLDASGRACRHFENERIFSLSNIIKTYLAGLTLLVLPISAQAAQSKIADLWFAHNAVTVMLGGADRIAATVCDPAIYPWLYRMAPAMKGAKLLPNGAPNVEDLLAQNIGLAFVPGSVPVAPLRSVGIDAHALSFDSVATMLAALDETAKALGTTSAVAEVSDYKAYLEQVSRRIAGRIETIPENQRPRVLHINNINPLRVDGSDTIIDEWIRLSGGRNAANGIVGNMKPVSIEQILAWQPDIIIVGGSVKDPLPSSENGWAGVQAVTDGHVYHNPMGVFLWDRYSTEFALQLQWASKLMAPQLFNDTDMIAATKDFYQRFFHYELSDADAKLILAARPPQQ
jgi:iron complex transport system substrate-binding protein